jgi:hypothetical protein
MAIDEVPALKVRPVVVLTFQTVPVPVSVMAASPRVRVRVFELSEEKATQDRLRPMMFR